MASPSSNRVHPQDHGLQQEQSSDGPSRGSSALPYPPTAPGKQTNLSPTAVQAPVGPPPIRTNNSVAPSATPYGARQGNPPRSQPGFYPIGDQPYNHPPQNRPMFVGASPAPAYEQTVQVRLILSCTVRGQHLLIKSSNHESEKPINIR